MPLPARRDRGVEIDGGLARLARLRIRDSGIGDAAVVHHFERTDALPFEEGRFDIVICNAVLEHIHPHRRGAHLREIWRVLKPGGLFFVFETPNRHWPIEGHTTGLPFVPYLPLGLARRYAILFSRRVNRHDSVEDLIDRGIRGVTFREITRRLPGCEYIPNNDIARYFGYSPAPESLLKRSAKALARAGYLFLEATLCRMLCIPGAAFLPRLSLCFRKQAAAPADMKRGMQ